MFVFAALALLATFAQINPIWLFGPYNPLNVSNGSQPDWYIGFLEGSLRLMPGVVTNIGNSTTGGYTFAWNVFIPTVVLPILFFTGMYAYPFFERWVTGDARPHNVLDRPRNTPMRTGIGVAVVTSAVVLQVAAGDDVLSDHLGLAVEDLVWVLRVGFFVLPVAAFFLTRRICVALQRSDRRKLRAGVPFGIAPQSPDGAAAAQPGLAAPQPELSYTPVSRPLSDEEKARLTAHRPDELIRPVPRHLVPLPTPRRALAQVRSRLNHLYLLPMLEAPYKDGSSDGQGKEDATQDAQNAPVSPHGEPPPPGD
jgi:ubiquinol-cytochrome c reductase cytochrome b subunit